MAKQKKEIDIMGTIFSSLWVYCILTFISVGAILYSIDQIQPDTEVKSICFWSFVSLLLVGKFMDFLVQSTFFVYKK